MDDLEARKVGYDLAAAFRILPWVFIVRDERDPRALVSAALRDAKGYIDGHDAGTSRMGLMRGLTTQLLRFLNITPDPEQLDLLLQEVLRQVDETVGAEHDPGLEGEEG